MNILITGAGGLLGSALARQLCNEYTVYALVHTLPEPSMTTKQIQYIVADLTELDTDILPQNIDAIYYLAQSNQFREFPDGATDMFNINVRAALRLAEWGRLQRVKKFVYASSGGVYKSSIKPVKESFKINVNEKNGFYLDSKLSAEILLKNYSVFFETFVILRPFFMYGPGQKQSMLIPRLINSVKTNQPITLQGDDGIHINPIFIEDAAAACKKLLTLKGESVFNIGGAEKVSLRQLGEIIGDIVGKTPVFVHNKQPANDLIADISLMMERLHAPSVHLHNGLSLTYQGMHA